MQVGGGQVRAAGWVHVQEQMQVSEEVQVQVQEQEHVSRSRSRSRYMLRSDGGAKAGRRQAPIAYVQLRIHPNAHPPYPPSLALQKGTA